jgi:hypothetical protein
MIDETEKHVLSLETAGLELTMAIKEWHSECRLNTTEERASTPDESPAGHCSHLEATSAAVHYQSPPFAAPLGSEQSSVLDW